MALVQNRHVALGLMGAGIVFLPLGVREHLRGEAVHRLFLAWPAFFLLGNALFFFPPSGPPDENGDATLATQEKLAIGASILLGAAAMLAYEWWLLRAH